MNQTGERLFTASRRPRLLSGVSETVLHGFLSGQLHQRDPAPAENDIVHLNNIFPTQYRGGRDFEVPEFAFKPDQWSRALLRGLSRFGKQGGFKGKAVAELGVGTGANVAYILSEHDPRMLYASDINGACTELATRNVARAVPPRRNKFVPIPGDQNLAGWLNHLPQGSVDVVYGCLPQVVKAREIDLHEGDNVAHYYDPALYPSSVHNLGLGLNDFALRQLHPLLPEGGTVILNLSGRPGKEEALEQMFKDAGYEPRLLHEEVIPQHAGTSLATLSAVEAKNGHRFEFFSSPEGSTRHRITATEAEKRRVSGKAVYHKIYVIAGVKHESSRAD